MKYFFSSLIPILLKLLLEFLSLTVMTGCIMTVTTQVNGTRPETAAAPRKMVGTECHQSCIRIQLPDLSHFRWSRLIPRNSGNQILAQDSYRSVIIIFLRIPSRNGVLGGGFNGKCTVLDVGIVDWGMAVTKKSGHDPI